MTKQEFERIAMEGEAIRIHTEDDFKVCVSHDCSMVTSTVERMLFAIKISQEVF